MKRSLAKVRESIKEASMIDLKDFLESIRKYSPKIGEVAMRHVSLTRTIAFVIIFNFSKPFLDGRAAQYWHFSQFVGDQTLNVAHRLR